MHEMLQKKASSLPCAVCKKGIGSNSSFSGVGCIKDSGTRSKLKLNVKFNCQAYANQETDIPEDCTGVE